MSTIHAPELLYAGTHDAPCYATHGSAGFDLRAELAQAVTLAPMERAAIPTGVSIKLPHGYELQVRPRSGLALKHGLTVINSPGTVDSDFFPNEVQVLLLNLSAQPYTIEPGERIAQGVIARYVVLPELVTKDTKTRAGGFGSTGS